jgi:hypothetical protein
MKGYASTDDPDAFARRLILRRSPVVSRRRDAPPLTLRSAPTFPTPFHPAGGERPGSPEEGEDLPSRLAEEILFRVRRERDIETERGGRT